MQQKKRDLCDSVRRSRLRAPHRQERDKVWERIAVSRRRGGIEVPDRIATMRKAVSVLALIAFACDILRDPLVHGDPAGNPEVAGRSDDYEYQVTVKSVVPTPRHTKCPEQIYFDLHFSIFYPVNLVNLKRNYPWINSLNLKNWICYKIKQLILVN